MACIGVGFDGVGGVGGVDGVDGVGGADGMAEGSPLVFGSDLCSVKWALVDAAWGRGSSLAVAARPGTRPGPTPHPCLDGALGVWRQS